MSKPRLLTEAELDALELVLPIGSENGISQRALSDALGWDRQGRKVRQGFQQLRRDRHIRVVAQTTTNGCFVATQEDIEALKKTRASMRSRAMSLLVTIKDLDEMIADDEWSPALFDADRIAV